MRVVIDTNIVVSRYLTPAGLAAHILSLWRADRFELLISEPILAEIHEVLLRPGIRARHRLDGGQVRRVVDDLRRFGVLVDPDESIEASPDPDDDKFLECAVAGGADVVVSPDPHLLDLRSFRGIRILSPAAFLAVLESEQSGGAASN